MSIAVTQLIAGVAVLGGITIGWLIRHSILTRQLKQSRRQIEEIKTLQMNLEHDVAEARKKLMTQSRTRKKDKTTAERGDDQTKETSHRAIEQLTEQLAGLKHENEDLQDQIGYLETEKTAWLEYRNTAHEEIKCLLKEVQSLQEQIVELKSTAPVSAGSVRGEREPAYVDKADGQTPAPSKVVMENTKQINVRSKTDRVEPRAAPEKHLEKVELAGKQGEDGRADFAKGAAAPDHQIVEKQSAKKQASLRKKPKTTRIERSTNEIIDNFKRDLGLPDY